MNKDSIAKTPSEEVREYDMARVEAIVNEELFPRLLEFNYPFKDHSFIYLDTYLRDLQRQKKRISEKALELALQHFEVEATEFEELTGIKVKKKALLQKEKVHKKVNIDVDADASPASDDTNTETGNQVDTQNSQVVDSLEPEPTALVGGNTKNRDFFEHGAITLPIQNRELWAGLLPDIDPGDLYINPMEGIYGYEDTPLITALYGIHANKVSTSQVREVIRGKKSKGDFKREGITIWLGNVSLFENPQRNADYEVLKFEVVSPELIQFYYHLKMNLPHTKLYPKYNPHATIAYLRKGAGTKYVHTDKGSQQPLTKLLINQAQYSDGKGNKTLINFPTEEKG